MARSMLNEKEVPQIFWADAMSTACYISNRAYIRKGVQKTPYEIYKGRKPNLSHLRVFGSKCFIHNNDKVNLGNLMLNLILVFSLDTLTVVKNIEFTIKEIKLLKNLFMLFLMR